MALQKSLQDPNPTVGLVLGAGGIRGIAHAAVLETLAEHDVPIDLVVGASIGSMFGLAFAAGLPVDYIASVARQATPLDVFRFYAGRLRPTRSNPIGRMLHEAGDGKTFDDLEIPFAVMGTNMATGLPERIDSGPVLPAVQASIALPFIARPVRHRDSYYLDGGIIDTAPVGAAHEMGAECVIAVCLGLNYTAPAFLQRRPWTRYLLERLGRQEREIVGRLRDQVRFSCRLYAACYPLGDAPPHPAEDADVAIWPDFKGLSPNSMFGAEFCYRQGKEAALAALPEIELMLRRPQRAS